MIEKLVTEDTFLLVNEAANFLRVAPATLYGWVHQRRIPFRKHGSRIIFARSDLESWSKSKEIRVLYSSNCAEQANYDSKKVQTKSSEGSLKTKQNVLEATPQKKGARRGYK